MNIKRLSVWLVVALVLIALIVGSVYLVKGFGEKRGQSEYTGHVVDVVEDKGVIFSPTWVNMKTNPRSSDIQSYCILPSDEEELLPKFYTAMEDGDRYTVEYQRPLYVNPHQCRNSDAIITDIRAVNQTES